MKEFLTAKEVAMDFLNGLWSYQKVLRLTRAGKIPAVKAGNSYTYHMAALQAWAEKNFSTAAWAKWKA